MVCGHALYKESDGSIKITYIIHLGVFYRFMSGTDAFSCSTRITQVRSKLMMERKPQRYEFYARQHAGVFVNLTAPQYKH